ncbi:MAG: ribosome biogenesis GTP-binding protein YihA/YsxC [Dongiaceae bacterium]
MSASGGEIDIEAGRRLFAQECRFVAGCDRDGALPPVGLPEIAFAGRSNVGKSSLVNALTGRTTLARVSHTPGRTQQLNFYNLGGRLGLVDMPGFGFARVAKTKIKDWTGLIERYLRGRPSLRRVCLLIDARHGAMAVDRGFMKRLDQAAVSYQVVLTKADKVKPPELARRLAGLGAELAQHTAAHPHVITTSAHSGAGIPELRAALATLAVPPRFD